TQFGSSNLQFQQTQQSVPNQFGNSSQLLPTQFAGNSSSQLPPTQLSSSLHYPPMQSMPGTVEVPQAPSSQAQSQSTGSFNVVQKVLLRVFGANLATNALFGVILGGVFAVSVGVLSTMLLLSIVHAIAPHISNSGGYVGGEDVVDY